MNVYVPHTLAI